MLACTTILLSNLYFVEPSTAAGKRLQCEMESLATANFQSITEFMNSEIEDLAGQAEVIFEVCRSISSVITNNYVEMSIKTIAVIHVCRPKVSLVYEHLNLSQAWHMQMKPSLSVWCGNRWLVNGLSFHKTIPAWWLINLIGWENSLPFRRQGRIVHLQSRTLVCSWSKVLKVELVSVNLFEWYLFKSYLIFPFQRRRQLLLNSPVVLSQPITLNKKRFLALKVQSVMICCVIPSSLFVPSFNSIHDTLQEMWAIENSKSFTPKCPWYMVTWPYISSSFTNKQSAVLLFIAFNGRTARGHCMHHFTPITYTECMFVS